VKLFSCITVCVGVCYGSIQKAVDKTKQSTSLNRRQPIAALPDVEQAIEVDNLRRYWYVSERCTVPSQHQRPAPPPLPPRIPSSPTHQHMAPPRSTSCEFRREYELLSEYQNAAAIVQLQTSPQGSTAVIIRTTTVTRVRTSDTNQHRRFNTIFVLAA